MNEDALAIVEPIHVPVLAWMIALASSLVLYFALQENGALLTENWVVMHEFFHDGRHVFGVPCH